MEATRVSLLFLLVVLNVTLEVEVLAVQVPVGLE